MKQNLQRLVFYTIEKAIKTYRQFAQKELKRQGLTITVDQWLTLATLHEHPGISQNELAAIVFKDKASITRILDLLLKAKYLQKKSSAVDGRRSELLFTPKGTELLRKTESIVHDYRARALKGISQGEISKINQVLSTIIQNCQ